MLRFFLMLLAALWVVPRLLRLALRAGPGGRQESARRARTSAKAGRPDPAERPSGFSQQDISDAEFEEIPPEE
jgi:hypothetical protein